MQERLISLVAGWLLDRTDAAELSAKSMSPDHSANIRQNVSDAVARLPKLTTGTASSLEPCSFSGRQAPHQTSCLSQATRDPTTDPAATCMSDQPASFVIVAHGPHIPAACVRTHARRHLCAGIDVNPRFYDCSAYEFTDEVAIFDLLDIPLVHGWLSDPQARSRLNFRWND